MFAILAYGCAVYEEPAPSSDSGKAGSAGSGGNASGGAKVDGGSAGKQAGGGAGATSGAGNAGTVGTEGGAAGEVSGAGTPNMGGSGEASPGGQGGGGNEGGAPPGCTTTAPDALCTCAIYAAHEYWFCPTFLGFTAAEAKCTARGMHLPKIESQQEDAWLFATCADLAMGEYYLGASDADVPNTWVWLQGGTFWQGVANGTPTGYTNWNGSEPNDSGECLVVQSNGPWDDRICGDQRKYVCEAAP